MTEVKFEEYLEIVTNKYHRTSLTKVRLGSHNFWIERGRWNKPKIPDTLRNCPLCGTREDEYHCYIECPRFVGNRKKLPNSLLKKPSMYKFINILNATDPVLLNKISAVSAGILADYENYK